MHSAVPKDRFHYQYWTNFYNATNFHHFIINTQQILTMSQICIVHSTALVPLTGRVLPSVDSVLMLGCVSISLMIRWAEIWALPASGAKALAFPRAMALKTIALNTLWKSEQSWSRQGQNSYLVNWCFVNHRELHQNWWVRKKKTGQGRVRREWFWF